MFKQVSELSENIFSKTILKNQCGFRKDHSTQQCLLPVLEKWKRSVDSGKNCNALLTDLPKAIDCLNHRFLIAKLSSYGFSPPALNLIRDYLSYRKRDQGLTNGLMNSLL